jgi:hypothetical protein
MKVKLLIEFKLNSFKIQNLKIQGVIVVESGKRCSGASVLWRGDTFQADQQQRGRRSGSSRFSCIKREQNSVNCVFIGTRMEFAIKVGESRRKYALTKHTQGMTLST